MIKANFELILLTTLSMFAFAGNSLLCRIALKNTSMDALSFTFIRILSAVIMLSLVIKVINPTSSKDAKPLTYILKTLPNAISLFLYAILFSYAYISLDTGIGALILFASVQITMILWGRINDEKLSHRQVIGLAISFIGLFFLLYPFSDSSLVINTRDAIYMVIAGMAWGVYSLLGKHSKQPLKNTLDSFMLASIIIIAIFIAALIMYSDKIQLPINGFVYAVLSGSITSGLGYTLWYKVLPKLTSIYAATVQLSVPVIATLLGIVFLNETLSILMLLSMVAILSGIYMVNYYKQKS